MPESTQHKLDRIRPPRVQITYDVETRGSFVKKELPFVVGIMSDLSGKGGQVDKDGKPIPLKDRKYMEIDRDNFNQIMEFTAPKVEVNGSELNFKTLDDFSPINVLKQIPGIKENFEKRTRLSDAIAKLDGNATLQQKFKELLSDADKRKNLKSALTELKAMLPAEPNGEKPPENPVVPPTPEAKAKEVPKK